MKDGPEEIRDNPAKYPDPVYIDYSKEPFIRASVICPEQYVGAVITLCIERRGVQKDMSYLDSSRVELTFDLPLSEVLFDFYDRLKSVSRGYASFDYEFLEYRRTDLSKVDILVAGEKVDALSMLVHRDRAYQRARKSCERLRKEIPRQLFKVAIQGAIGGKIIARETVSPLRKDVTAKCYGGDITRKKKLLEKQKEGKKRMKQVGNVSIPQSAFLAVLKADEEE
jgi:GTP-binding protein LepA